MECKWKCKGRRMKKVSRWASEISDKTPRTTQRLHSRWNGDEERKGDIVAACHPTRFLKTRILARSNPFPPIHSPSINTRPVRVFLKFLPKVFMLGFVVSVFNKGLSPLGNLGGGGALCAPPHDTCHRWSAISVFMATKVVHCFTFWGGRFVRVASRYLPSMLRD